MENAKKYQMYRSRSMYLLLLRDLKLLTQCSVLVLFRFSSERSRFLFIRCGEPLEYRTNLTAFKMLC